MGKMNRKGACASLKPGDEKFEYFTMKAGIRTVVRCQYDYRCGNGDLFSCVGKSFDSCRDARDEWLKVHHQPFVCPDCHGTGAREIYGESFEKCDTVVDVKKCLTCNGTGEVMEDK